MALRATSRAGRRPPPGELAGAPGRACHHAGGAALLQRESRISMTGRACRWARTREFRPVGARARGRRQESCDLRLQGQDIRLQSRHPSSDLETVVAPANRARNRALPAAAPEVPEDALPGRAPRGSARGSRFPAGAVHAHHRCALGGATRRFACQPETAAPSRVRHHADGPGTLRPPGLERWPVLPVGGGPLNKKRGRARRPAPRVPGSGSTRS